MCGIAGIWGKVDEAGVRKMIDVQRHRGPDGLGVHVQVNRGVLGHTRLAIMDPVQGRQPVYNEDRSSTLVANGMIYNHPQLRRQLGGDHLYSSTSDSETILHIFEDHGLATPHLLDGMFAFAISADNRLLLARDRIGIKPLYYARRSRGKGDETLYFASELKALAPLCEDVKEFPPGTLYDSESGFHTYYQVPDRDPLQLTPADHARRIREIVEAAVKKRLLSDVPLGGTSRKLRERLFEEIRTNVALNVEEGDSAESFTVSGRGELHLAILIETMRREGYEFQVSRPEVILHDEDGIVLEPWEEVYIETSSESVGSVVEMLGKRRGNMLDLQEDLEDAVRLSYLVPTRGLLGFRYHFMTATRGAGFMHSVFHDYLPLSGGDLGRSQGSLVAWERGITTTYGLKNAEERGILFLGPGVEVYEGMVVGEHQRPEDLVVNVCKKRHVTNVRSSFREIDERLTPPREMSLDQAIEYLGDDELLEVTPKNLRIRKRILDSHRRNREVKRAKEALGA